MVRDLHRRKLVEAGNSIQSITSRVGYNTKQHIVVLLSIPTVGNIKKLLCAIFETNWTACKARVASTYGFQQV